MNFSQPQLLDFPKNGSENLGYLSFVQDAGMIPFDIKRIYWIYDIYEVVARGNHAHKTDQQVIICITGNAEIEMISQDGTKHFFSLNHPSQGLYVPKLYWKNLSLSKGACLVCVSSTLYSEDDYIKDFDQFIIKTT